ncbi:MAG: Tex family protein [Spirochaetales bacterium]
MNEPKVLSLEFNMPITYAGNIIKLLDDGATIPFIARYRKEMHGSCDDQTLRVFADRLHYLRSLSEKQEEVIRLIEAQEKLTPELKAKIENANTLTEIEDIYRPYRPKRKTRASEAIAKGLQPLADYIFAQKESLLSLEEYAKGFIDEEKGIKTVEEAITGAKDIIAESVSDNADMRKRLREFMFKTGQIETSIKDLEAEGAKTYEMYASHKEPIQNMPSHRVLAINRGEKEKHIKVSILVNGERALEILKGEFVKEDRPFADIINLAIEDSYNRLIFPSLEREIRNMLTDEASEQAIKMFEVNLKPLLMQPPLKGKTILGIDPGYRTGCKVAVIDENGNVLDTGVIYPTPPRSDIEGSEITVARLIKKHGVNVISIGNGTATKETEIFVANLNKRLKEKISYAIVNEAGASVYSASKLGAEEFPEYDVALRSAVSIARRLQDPLAELIKIDVKSIGVGQYQHDMPQKRLTEVLDGVVEDCVNSVGVDLNTASPSLLSQVSGLNDGVAKNIVEYKAKNGEFKERGELLSVPKLGGKAYEQAAGFLRIHNGKNVLDNTAVHPESYGAVKKLLKEFNLTEKDVENGNIKSLPTLIEEKGEETVAQKIGIGIPTLKDIVSELLKPGRDIRDSLPQLELKSDILDINDLKEGMILNGTVRNVIDFGAFVDIGVHQDGLVHISEICNHYIKHPSEELKVGDQVKVKILGVDLVKNRISLSIKKAIEL